MGPGADPRRAARRPGLPGPAAATGAAGPLPWTVGDAEGFALRLDRLGVDGATAAALAAEPAERLAERAVEPDWASYAEEVLAAAPEGLPEVEVGGEGPDAFARPPCARWSPWPPPASRTGRPTSRTPRPPCGGTRSPAV